MLKKWRMAFTKNLTMANWMERGIELHGENQLNAYLDKPLDYHVLKGNEVRAKESLQFVNRVSNVLVDKLHTSKGDRIAVCTSNNLDLAMIIYGIMKIGRIAVPLNYMLKGKEISYIIENSGASICIIDKQVFESSIKDTSRMPWIKQWVMAGPEADVLPDFISLDKLMTEVSDKLDPPAMDKDDVVGIFYTSGTTGFPKGAMVTSRSLLTPQAVAAALLPLRLGDISAFCLPISHMMGFAILFLGAFSGASGYLIPHFDPQRVLEITEKYKCNAFVGVPAMYAMLMYCHPEKYDLSSVRFWGSAADAMPSKHIEVFRKMGTFFKIGPIRIPSLFAEVYGMVELTGAAAMRPAIPGIRFKEGCVGFPVFPARIRVVDDEGRKVKVGQEGEIVVKGPGVCRGYWKNDDATRDIFTKDRWFRTGDIGKKSKLGLIYFADRKKDVIKCGGYSIFSVEVEKEMLAHPKIGNVAVLGIPHPTKGQMPIACVTLKEDGSVTSQEILDWCKENIAAYKAPREIKILSQSEMPYTMTLKIMKKKLRERYSKEYMQ